MKQILILLGISCANLLAEDLTVTVSEPVPVVETTAVETEKTELKIKYVIVDAVQKHIEIEYEGRAERQFLRGEKYEAFRAIFTGSLAPQVSALVSQQFAEDSE